MPRNLPTYLFGTLFLLTSSGIGNAEEALAKYLVSDDATVRNRAISEFEHLSTKEKQALVPDLLMAVDDEDPAISKDASRLLEEMGVGARSPTASLQQTAAGEKETVEDSIDPRTPDDRQTDRDKQVEEMHRQLESERKLEFGHMPEEDSSPRSMVLEALQDPDPLLHSHAARQLSVLHPIPVEAIPRLEELLHASDTESRSAAAAALGAMGPAAQPALPTLLKSMAAADSTNKEILEEAVRQIQNPA